MKISRNIFWCSFTLVSFLKCSLFFHLALLEYQKVFTGIHSDEQSSDKAVTGLDHLMGSNCTFERLWGRGSSL